MKIRRYLPVIAALVLVAGLGGFVVFQKNKTAVLTVSETVVGPFIPRRTCRRLPTFLREQKIPQPVTIDLSQKRFKGVALLYGKDLTEVLHPKQWEQYEHFSTYALDEVGNIYLVPTPFISIRPTTFNLQKKLYKLDSASGKISIFMEIEDVKPTASNPYGINAIAYDCDDHTLWVSAIDESNYQAQKGIIYHIDPRTKKILQRIKGFDALTLKVAYTQKGKYLLAGSARDAGLYAFRIMKHKMDAAPYKLLDIPDPNEHVRKIKVSQKNRITLETVPFSYSLIARAAKKDRTHYVATWSFTDTNWRIRRGK